VQAEVLQSTLEGEGMAALADVLQSTLMAAMAAQLHNSFVCVCFLLRLVHACVFRQ